MIVTGLAAFVVIALIGHLLIPNVLTLLAAVAVGALITVAALAGRAGLFDRRTPGGRHRS